MIDFTLPELGEQIESGDVLRIMVKAGDTIAKDQPVLELETDKATIEVPSSVAGKVKEIKVKAGDKGEVGQAILSVEDNGAADAAPKQAAAKVRLPGSGAEVAGARRRKPRFGEAGPAKRRGFGEQAAPQAAPARECDSPEDENEEERGEKSPDIEPDVQGAIDPPSRTRPASRISVGRTRPRRTKSARPRQERR